MRIVGLVFGLLFILAALVVAAWEGFIVQDPEGFRLRAAGEVWYRIDAPSLNLVQAVVERYLWPPLWDPVIVNLLYVPAILLFLVPGLVLFGLGCLPHFRRRSRRLFK